MPPGIYKKVLEQTLTTLRKHYEHIGSPIEAPGKPTYWDIDIMVATPVSPDFDTSTTTRQVIAQNLSSTLSAAASILEPGNPTINLAIPWPSSPTQAETDEKKFVQIDIHICPNKKDWTWNLFHAAHGDLWNILGTTIRPFGLTVNDKGLYLRIPEIELLDRKKSMIFLTCEPSEILDYLGLDEGKWWSEFGSRREMFEFAAGCRMFWVKEKGFHDLDVVREFVIKNWKRAGEIGLERQQKRALEGMKAKVEKKRRVEETPTKEAAP